MIVKLAFKIWSSPGKPNKGTGFEYKQKLPLKSDKMTGLG